MHSISQASATAFSTSFFEAGNTFNFFMWCLANFGEYRLRGSCRGQYSSYRIRYQVYFYFIEESRIGTFVDAVSKNLNFVAHTLQLNRKPQDLSFSTGACPKGRMNHRYAHSVLTHDFLNQGVKV